jgi:hypothetical protein
MRVEASRDGIPFYSRRNQFVYQICLLNRSSLDPCRTFPVPANRSAWRPPSFLGNPAPPRRRKSSHRENVLVRSVETGPLASDRPLRRLHIALAAGVAQTAKSDPKKETGFGELPKGPLQIVVSIDTQTVTLFSNGVHVAQGPVSTGVPGHPTLMGVFSIIEKDRYHHSNLYSNAPMGVALHEGVLPASHGCIRMSHDFAQKLWRVTKLGVRVFVARHELAPVDFAHPICSDQSPSRRSLPSPSASPMDAAARRQS